MNNLLLITDDSVRALLRQKLLVGLILGAFCFTLFFGWFSAQILPKAHDYSGQQGDDRLRAARASAGSVVQGAFYAAFSFGGSVVAAAIFSTAVASEIRRGTVRITLSKPVSRSQFLLGKFLGGVAVMAVYALLAGAAMVALAKTSRLDLPRALVLAPWLMFCRQLMMGSIVMALSLELNPLIAAILAFFTGNGIYGQHNPLFYILPSYDAFNVFGHVLAGSVVSSHHVILLSFYAVDFITLMLLLAVWRFHTKELI